MDDRSSPADHLFLSGGGRAGALMRARDWQATSLGSPVAWPQALKTLVGVMLASGQPMFVAWGPERLMLYNDGYAPILDARHPSALGEPFFAVWPEARDALTPLFDQVFAGEPVHMDDIELRLDRPGRPKEAHFAFSYTPVRDEDGSVAGLFCPCTETTDQVLAERAKADAAERQRRIFQQMPGFVGVLTGPDHVFAYVNDAYVAMAGPRQFIGRGVREVFPELVGHAFHEPLDRVYATGEPFAARAMPITLERADGDRFIDLLYQPVRDDAGDVTGIFVGGYDVTEQMRAEAELRDSEARVRLLADAVPHMVWITAASGRNEFFNRQWRDYTGQDWGTTATEIAENAIHPDDGEATVAAFTASLSSGSPFEIEHRIRSKAGDYRWFLARAEAYRDPVSGEITRWYGASVDIEDRKRVEHALRESESRLRELNADLERKVTERALSRGRTWQLSPDMLGVINAAGYFESTNPAWTLVLGWSEEEVAKRPFLDFIHPDDLADTQAAWVDATERGVPALRFENRYLHKDGSWRWLSWVAVPDDGKVYCSAREITEEKDRAAALASRTAERDRLWRNTQDMQVVIDETGTFRAVSPAFTTILGWTHDEVVGRTVFDFVLADDEASTGGALAHAREDALPTFVNRYRHKDGGYRWISWVAAPEEHLIYASGRNVTAEKEQAIELASAQEALRQSQKMEAVGQLTGGIAHDFNNLLTGISGSMEMLQTRLSQGRVNDLARYITAAQGASKRAAALTHRLLAFSRRQTLDPKPTDVARLVVDMADLIRRTVGPEITLETVNMAGLWATLVDPNQLENALLNLCINARDAMPDGGRLTIETSNRWMDQRAGRERDLPAGQYLSLCVSDTGTGMPPDVVERAFDPFFTTKPIGLGTGLGLSMAYGFARQSGGQVRIYSEVGQGSMVCIYLPRHHGTEATLAERDEVSEAPRAEQGETVLVVDDEPTVRMLVTDILEDLGYAALEAGDGPSGLRILQSDTRIDLLVTDVGLPGGMNGRQVADAARVARPGLKVLFITGYAENAVLNHGHLDHGMHVLTKPFDVAVLAARIRDLIAG